MLQRVSMELVQAKKAMVAAEGAEKQLLDRDMLTVLGKLTPFSLDATCLMIRP